MSGNEVQAIFRAYQAPYSDQLFGQHFYYML